MFCNKTLLFSFTACDCDPIGSEDDGLCDGYTDKSLGYESGLCHCKRNVDGVRCDHCKPGYWNLNENNPDGCEGESSLIFHF